MPRYFLLLLLICVALSCDNDSSVDPAREEISVSATYASECGGVLKAAKSATPDMPFVVDAATYCNSELLYWQYYEDAKVLKLLNTRISLNCCGIRAVTASSNDQRIVISESDKPEEDGGRCRCMCCYDYYIELAGVIPGKRAMRLELTVDDSTKVKWSGSIDLSGGNGIVVIDETVLKSGCPR